MSSEIINKIEKAGLVIVDVSDFEPKLQLNNIDLAFLAKGFYYLNIENFDGELINKKIIKK